MVIHMDSSHLLRRRILFACCVMVASVLMLALTAGAAPTNASAATYSYNITGGQCVFGGTQMAISTGSFRFYGGQAPIHIYRWTRLVDVNGNAQTNWGASNASAWVYPGGSKVFGASTIYRGIWRLSSRIQDYYALYNVNGALLNTALVTTVSYANFVNFGGSLQGQGTTTACYN
jgi:hypothetical protein